MEKYEILVTFQGFGSFEVVLPLYGSLRLEQGKSYYIVNAYSDVIEFLRTLYQCFVRININPSKVEKVDLVIDYDKLRSRSNRTVEANKNINLADNIVQPVSSESEEAEAVESEDSESDKSFDPAKYVWTKGKNKGRTVEELDKLGKLPAVLRTATDEEKEVIEAYRNSKEG